MRGVALDAHPAAAAIALLPPPQLVVQKRLIDRYTRRDSAEERYKGLAVALAGCGETKHDFLL
jgi:hypothetical protein